MTIRTKNMIKYVCDLCKQETKSQDIGTLYYRTSGKAKKSWDVCGPCTVVLEQTLGKGETYPK